MVLVTTGAIVTVAANVTTLNDGNELAVIRSSVMSNVHYLQYSSTIKVKTSSTGTWY